MGRVTMLILMLLLPILSFGGNECGSAIDGSRSGG